VSIPTLKKRSEFLRVAAARNMTRTPTIWVQCCYDEELFTTVRVGFTASRKVGNAVKRNRAKRRMREISRLKIPMLLKEYPLFKGAFVLIAVSGTIDSDYEKLCYDFECAVRACLARFSSLSLHTLKGDT
jgi:ribonuclease P protein component